MLPGLLGEPRPGPGPRRHDEKVDEIADQLLAAGLIGDLLMAARSRPGWPGSSSRLSGGRLRHLTGQSWRDRLPGYFELLSNTKILDVVESLIGPEIFANPVYNVRPKVPRVAAGEVPWHQDKSYWPGARSNPVITVWVASVGATMENGCLRVIPRTQHEARRRVPLRDLFRDRVPGAGRRRRRPSRGARALPVPVGAGWAIIFNDRFIHSSGPNASAHIRWSVDLRYQPADQDPMPQHGAGFLARSRAHPERVASLDDWRAQRMEAATP